MKKFILRLSLYFSDINNFISREIKFQLINFSFIKNNSVI